MSKIDLIHGNCLQVIKDFKPMQFDAVITDLPYGNNTSYDEYQDSEENLINLINEFMPLALAVAKRVVITCGVANIYKYPEPKWILSWFTPAGTGSGPWGFCCWQPILVYGKDPYLQARLGRRPDSISFTGKSEKRGHPCPKPVPLMKWIVERTTLEGQTVLDPFAGQGTTLEACWELERDVTGIELSKTYYNIGVKQITEIKKQPPLIKTIKYKKEKLL